MIVCLFIASRRAPEYLRLNTKLIEMVQCFFTENKPVAAVCHSILADKAIVDGNLATAPAWLGHLELIKAFLDIMRVKISL